MKRGTLAQRIRGLNVEVVSRQRRLLCPYTMKEIAHLLELYARVTTNDYIMARCVEIARQIKGKEEGPADGE